MARNKRRVNTSNANQRLPISVSYHGSPSYNKKPSWNAFKDIQDMRTFHPLSVVRPQRTTTTRYAISYPVRRPSLPNRDVFARLRDLRGAPQVRLTFRAPRQVLTCVRRKQRREVLHALKKTGGRGAPHRRPRFNQQSTISCRK